MLDKNTQIQILIRIDNANNFVRAFVYDTSLIVNKKLQNFVGAIDFRMSRIMQLKSVGFQTNVLS